MASMNDLFSAKTVLRERLLVQRFIGKKVGGYKLTFQAIETRESLDDNIHAVGIGSKIVKGQSTPIQCVRIYVARKFAKSFLPKKKILPELIDEIPTDVIESPPAIFFKYRKRPGTDIGQNMTLSSLDLGSNKCEITRPIVAGISSAHKDITGQVR